MTTVFGSWGTAQNGLVLVPAQAGKIIRVVRVLCTAWVGIKAQLQSDPGPDPLNLTPSLHIGPEASLVLPLGRSGAVATQRGKALGVSTAFQSGAGEHSVMVWYEVVS
jgi:hypothetical protein